jgi:DNA polymerase III subunit epsilon
MTSLGIYPHHGAQHTSKIWASGPLAAFDVETDSADPLDARIIQAALYIDDPSGGGHCFTYLLQPVRDIDLSAVAIHGLSTEHATAHGEPPREALADIVDKIGRIAEAYGPIPLCIYNAVFDVTVLERELRRHGVADGYRIPLPLIDPLTADRKLDRYRRGRRTLTAVAAAYGIGIERAHQADGDVVTTVKLARAMGRKFPKFGRADLGRLQQLQREAYRDWTEHFQRFRRRSDPGFECSPHWPLIPLADDVTA